MSRRVLVVDDEKLIVKGIRFSLEQDGYDVDCAYDGEEALKLAKENAYDIILLDVMLPKYDGFEVCQQIREYSDVPIIMLTAKGDDMDKILGLDIGADAYITKPFNPLEVVANVKAIIRRCYKYEEENNQKVKIVVGELEFDEEEYTVRKNGEKINLTNTETKILSKMMKEPGKIFTREQLYKCINNQYFETDDNTIMVHISNIRSKIKDEQSKYIKTIRGVGYKIDKI